MEPILDQGLKDAILTVMEMDNDLDFADTVVEAIRLRCAQTGEVIEIEGDTDEECELIFKGLFDQCVKFIIDEVLVKLVLDGMVEVGKLDENGDFMYGLTEEGKKLAEDRFGL